MTGITQYLPAVFTLYLLLINVFAVILTLSDKYRAKCGKWRIPESTLLLFGFLGGALCEWIAMLLIRHKTKHSKLMLLLPLFFTLHILLLGFFFMYLYS